MKSWIFPNPTAGMLEPETDDRDYNSDRFSRHDVLKLRSTCLRFAPVYGHFRRHADILKRLPCLQLIFSRSVAVGMMMIFEAYHACACKFFAASDRQKFEASSWAGVGPMHIKSHWFHGVGEWGTASNFQSQTRSAWTVTCFVEFSAFPPKERW